MSYLQNENCTGWQFKTIPAFTKGSLSPVFANCGTGLNDDSSAPCEDCSFMHTFTGVDKNDITGYFKLLETDGFRKTYENEICGNLFAQFSTDEGLFYISYLKGTKTARFILDRCKGISLDKFGFRDYEDKRGNTVFAQYALYYDKMIRGTTCDCGMNYVFRLRDNTLIIIDGGEIEQSTDCAIDDYIKFLHEITGTKPGEKITVSLWLCTHSHNDHMDFFSKLLRICGDTLEVKRAGFNFPCHENTRSSDSVSLLKERLKEYCPGIEYSKLHAGAQFNIANAKITVILSNEDVIGVDEEDTFPGLNSTSLSFIVEAEGKKAFFLADMGDLNGGVMIKNYSKEFLSSDYLQAAHHGINSIYDIYEYLDTKSVLLPQCQMNMDTRFSENLEHLSSKYGIENILLAFDATDIFTLDNGKCIQTKRKRTGEPYDGSQL